MKPTTPKTELPPSTQLRKAVFGSSLKVRFGFALGFAFLTATAFADVAGYFKFDNFPGDNANFTDDAGKGLRGLLGFPFSEPRSLPGPSGQAGDLAVSFDGKGALAVDDSAAQILNFLTPPLTLECWVRATNFPGRHLALISYGIPGGPPSDRVRGGYKLGIAPDTNILFTLFAVVDVNSGVPFPIDSQWHHVAAAYSSADGGVRFYLDGVAVAFVAETRNITPPGTRHLDIGAQDTGLGRFGGDIDRVRVSTAALTPDQLDSVAGAVKPVRNDTAVFFNFDEASPPYQGQGLPPAGVAISTAEWVISHPPRQSDGDPDKVTDTPSAAAGDLALQFGGSDMAAVSDPNGVLNLNGDWTLEAWVKFRPPVADALRDVIFYYGHPGRGYSLSLTTNRLLQVTTLGIADLPSATAVVEVDVWQHLAVVHKNGESITYFINGIEAGTRSYAGGTSLAATNRILYIGAEWNGGLPFSGLIDRVRISNSALTANQLDSDPLNPAVTVLPDILPNNFWVNPTFELGSNLDQTTGTVSNWNRGGNDPTICQVITENSVSASHSLAVIDANAGDFYGDWYSDVLLSGHASGGDTLDIQWYEMYNLAGPEMRLTVLFLDASDNVVGQTHFVTSGTSNPGWVSTIADSTFTKRNGSLAVPPGAVKMRCSLVSGGSGTITGVMVIDDLSVARAPVANLLFGNFWVNPSFELGTDLDQTNGTPSNWNRGGSDITICQVLTNNFASSNHVLAVVDPSSPTRFGEWYSDVLLSGNASPGDVVNIQWYEMFNIANGEMRLTVRFLDAMDNGPDNHFVATGQSAGWQGTIASSSFVKRNHSLTVRAGAVKMRIALVSGGPEATTGVYLIDDISVARAPQAALLPDNFWVNSTFETGSGLDQTNGTPSNWNRGGSDTTICQVTTSNYTSASHALALVDPSVPVKFGEWYSDVFLSGNASPGDVVNIQWYEMFNIANGEMRLTVRFLDAMDNGPDNHFVATGQSAGWQGNIADSTFTQRNASLAVPLGAVKMRIALVSGGPEATTGVYLIDDLSVARAAQADLLPGNFWVNSTFETGSSLDQTNGAPSNWNRGGSDTTICQVTTNNFTSATHALALVDPSSPIKFGEWYSDVLLSGKASPGDVVNIQWYEMFNIANGEMRLTVRFLDAMDNGPDNHFVATGQSAGWQGTIASSTFVKRNHSLTVRDGAVKMRIALVSGGPEATDGVYLIDDLSVGLSKPLITQITPQAGGFDLTWVSIPGKNYTVQFASTLGSPTVWTPLATGLASGGLSTTYSDSAIHPGNTGFYRVIQE